MIKKCLCGRRPEIGNIQAYTTITCDECESMEFDLNTKKAIDKWNDSILFAELAQQKGIDDCKAGFPSNSDDVYYLGGYGFQYAKEQQISGVNNEN